MPPAAGQTYDCVPAPLRTRNFGGDRCCAKWKVGAAAFFSSQFSMQVKDRANIRLDCERGGGPLLDIGIYCINAARALFQSEPIAVQAIDATSRDPRFREVPESVACLL